MKLMRRDQFITLTKALKLAGIICLALIGNGFSQDRGGHKHSGDTESKLVLSVAECQYLLTQSLAGLWDTQKAARKLYREGQCNSHFKRVDRVLKENTINY